MKNVMHALVAIVILTMPTTSIAQVGDDLVNNESEKYSALRQTILDVQRKALENPTEDKFVEPFLALLPRSGDLFVVEGDIFLSGDGVKDYLLRRGARDPQPPPEGELVVEKDAAGNRMILPRDRRNLQYAFDVSSFPSTDLLEVTVAHARDASRAWENACPYTECGISFAHLRKLDGNPVPGQGVDFVIRYNQNLGANVLARAFFPKDPQETWFLEVAPIFFTSDLNQLGVMIHEFGHVLGYWHEHLLGEEAGCFVSPEWKDFIDTSLEAIPVTGQPTIQDRLSPMHYPCGKVTDYADKLSPRDIAAHRETYRQ